MKLLEDYKVITITHHNLNVDELGYFVVKHSDDEDLKEKLDALKYKMQISELVYLSTCNRVSFIFVGDTDLSKEYLQQFFKIVNADLRLESLEKIDKYVSTYTGLSAVNHVFEVASSMDSLVVGEREIFRQLRSAFEKAQQYGNLGESLRMLERFTVVAAKEVYAKTKIGEKALSIVSLAVQELYNAQIDADSRILIVGAGETNTLLAKFLQKRELNNVTVFNRSLDNAANISKMLDAKAFHLTELADYSEGFDILIVCTAATDPVITTSIYRQLLQRSTDKKVVVDLSVPANVSSEVVDAFDLKYIDIETLRGRAEVNLEHRKKELVAARKLLRVKLIEFQKGHQQRQLELMLHIIPKDIKAVKQHAVSTVYAKKLETLDDNSKALVMEMMDYMEKKCISVPMKAAKALI